MARQRMPPPMADLPASRCMSVRVCVRTCVRKHSASPLSERAGDRGNGGRGETSVHTFFLAAGQAAFFSLLSPPSPPFSSARKKRRSHGTRPGRKFANTIIAGLSVKPALGG